MTTATVFDHRGRTKKNATGPIEVRITIERKVYYIGTGVHVKATQFKRGIVINHPQANELNNRVRLVQTRIEQEINKAFEAKCNLDIAKLRKAVISTTAEDKSTPTLLTWIEEQLPLLKISYGTFKHYKTLVTALTECKLLRRWSDLTPENLYKFDAWLHTRKKPLSEAERLAGKAEEYISDACVYNYHKCLKALLNRAVLFGELSANPYEKLKKKFNRGEKENVEYLTESEMLAIESLHPVPGSVMAVCRDLFILQMYTGLSFTDMQRFDFTRYKLIDGTYQYTGTRIKTGTAFVGQLLPPVVEILQRYNWKVPQVNNADYNHNLKGLGMSAGISIPLHSHLARHTFATYMLRNGVRIENVSKMLGHTNIRQTQRYAKVLAQSVHEDFSMIAKKIQNRHEKDNADAGDGSNAVSL